MLEGIVFVTFWILLVAALWMLNQFYICDSQNCKPYTIARENGEIGTKGHTESLVREMGQDGIWPIPYIGAAIATALLIWFLGVPFTIKNYGLSFFVIFVVLYFMMSHFLHHYLGPIQNDIETYLRASKAGLDESASISAGIEEPHICLPSEYAEENSLEPIEIFDSL